MSQIISQSLIQLVAQTPVILVYVAGIVFALVLRPRALTAGLMALIALLLLLAMTLAHPFAMQYLIHSRIEAGADTGDMARLFAVWGIVTSLFHAAGLGLLVAAVFVGRPVPPPVVPRGVYPSPSHKA